MQNERLLWRLFWLMLAGLAMLHAPKWLQGPVGADPVADRAYDFRTPYLAGQLWLSGQDPYDDSALKAHWQQQCAAQGLTSHVPPGTPLTDMLYPPWAVPIFAALSPLSYPAAQFLYLIISLLSLIMIAIAVSNWAAEQSNIYSWPAGWWGVAALVLVVLAAKATVPALRVGQPLWLALAAGFGALVLSKKENDTSPRHWLAGVLLGVAALKFTVALPFGALLLLQGRWRVLVGAAATVLLLTTIYVAVHPEGIAALPHYLSQGRIPDQLLLQDGAGGTQNQLSYYMKSFTGLDAWVAYLAPSALPVAHIVLAVLWAGLFGYVLWAFKRKQWAGLQAFVVLAIGALLSFYHMFYDVLLLLPLALWAAHKPLNIRLIILSLSLPFFLPLTAVLDASPLPDSLAWLYLYQPIALLGLLGVVLAQPALRKA